MCPHSHLTVHSAEHIAKQLRVHVTSQLPLGTQSRSSAAALSLYTYGFVPSNSWSWGFGNITLELPFNVPILTYYRKQIPVRFLTDSVPLEKDLHHSLPPHLHVCKLLPSLCTRWRPFTTWHSPKFCHAITELQCMHSGQHRQSCPLYSF